ncbi:hypothetical protein ACWDOP_00265 [Nocardia sp. NPDC003693]
MIRQKHVFEAECDRCETPLGFADEGVAWHFPSPESAAAELAECGWAQVGDRVLCGCCLARQGCELLGHTWGQWSPFEIGPEFGGGYEGLRRACALCPSTELDPPMQLILPDRKER